MKRLFQVGAMLMLIGAFYPLLEIFDRWDASGLSNDTEFTVCAFLITICLVLLLCKLISSRALSFAIVFWRLLLQDTLMTPVRFGLTSVVVLPPLIIHPLRI